MNNGTHSRVDCFLIDSCANDNIHKDFRKAIGANCIFYSAQTHELIVLVSTLSSLSLGFMKQVNVLGTYPQKGKCYRGAVKKAYIKNVKVLNKLNIKVFLGVLKIMLRG